MQFQCGRYYSNEAFMRFAFRFIMPTDLGWLQKGCFGMYYETMKAEVVL